MESRQREREEITDYMRMLNEKEDEIDSVQRRFQRDEEEEEIEIRHALVRLEEIQEGCSVNDFKVQQLIDEQREILNKIQSDKYDFADEFARRVAEERQKIDAEREELKWRLYEIDTQDKEEESKGQ